MGTKHLMDTNAVIEFLGGTLPTSGSQWVQNIIEDDLQHLSVINQIELLGFNGSPMEMKILQEFIEATDIVSLSNPIVEKTIELRKNYKIKLPDAIIAATALVHDFTLVSRNVSDFKRIVGLNCVDAHLM